MGVVNASERDDARDLANQRKGADNAAGWTWSDPPPAILVDYGAGLGDTATLGATDIIRRLFDIDGGIDKASTAYGVGELSGILLDGLMGGAAGWRAIGNKAKGMEFSHWIPNRMGGPRSKWNGNFVTPQQHYMHDPYRYPKGWRELGDRYGPVRQQWDRIPRVYQGILAGGLLGAEEAAMADLSTREP